MMEDQRAPLSPSDQQANIFACVPLHKEDGQHYEDVVSMHNQRCLSDMYQSSACFLMLAEFRRLMQCSCLNLLKVQWSM